MSQRPLTRLRGFAVFKGIGSWFINELAKKVCPTSGGAGDGGGGDFGRRLIRQLELEVPDQKLKFRLGLGVAGQQQFPPAGCRQMNIDHPHGGEFLQSAVRGQSWRQGMRTALERASASSWTAGSPSAVMISEVSSAFRHVSPQSCTGC
jgi:hypothetical protein